MRKDKEGNWFAKHKFLTVILAIVVVSTVLIVIPPVADYSGFNMTSVLISAILFVLGIVVGYWMSGLEKKYK